VNLTTRTYMGILSNPPRSHDRLAPLLSGAKHAYRKQPGQAPALDELRARRLRTARRLLGRRDAAVSTSARVSALARPQRASARLLLGRSLARDSTSATPTVQRHDCKRSSHGLQTDNPMVGPAPAGPVFDASAMARPTGVATACLPERAGAGSSAPPSGGAAGVVKSATCR